jgi:DNA-binding LytR/AlgR family response regulator
MACTQIFVKMAVKKTSGSQKHETHFDIKAIKEKFPDLGMINTGEKVYYFNGNDILFINSAKNYCSINLTNKRNIILTKPAKEICKYCSKFVECIDKGLALNLARMVELDKKEPKIYFDDDSELVLKRKQEQALYQLSQLFNKEE